LKKSFFYKKKAVEACGCTDYRGRLPTIDYVEMTSEHGDVSALMMDSAL
jgi:hypothetical protein